MTGFLGALKSDDGRARVPSPAPGTLSWIPDHPTVNSWLTSKSSQWLWIHGKPGSGKSILAKSLVERSIASSKDGEQITCSYFFNYASPDQRSTVSFFRALLYQLLKQTKCSSCMQEFEDVILSKTSGRLPQNWIESPSGLDRYLQFVMPAIAQTRACFLIVDGLDECDRQTATDVITFLRHKTHKLALDNLRICVTTRYTSLPLEGEAQLFIDSENRSDILNYISLQARGCKVDCPHQQAQRLSEEILKRADGVFLWVRLVLSRLYRAFEVGENLFDVLFTLPNDLRGLYKRLLGQIEIDRTIFSTSIRSLVELVVSAVRPLSLTEMYSFIALACRPKDAKDDMQSTEHYVHNFEGSALVFAKQIVSECEGLICVGPPNVLAVKVSIGGNLDGKSEVQFIHFSVVEYLREEGFQSNKERPNPSPRFECRAHLEMAEKTILSLDSAARLPELYRSCVSDVYLALPCVRYTVEHWTYHLKAAEQDTTWSQKFIALWERIVDVPILWCRKIQQALPGVFPEWILVDTANALHLTSHLNLKQGSKVVLDIYRSRHQLAKRIDSVCGRDRTPLSIAAENGHSEIVQYLLEKGADFTIIDSVQGQTPLHWAAFAGHTKVVEDLIRAGADINDCRNGTTPLTQCAAQGHKNCVQVLLSHGADTSLGDTQRGQSALSLAILGHHTEVASLLCEYGADVNAKDTHSDFLPIHHALMSRSPKMVQKLVSLGARYSVRENLPDPTRLDMWLDRLSLVLPLDTIWQKSLPLRQCGQKGSGRSSRTMSRTSRSERASRADGSSQKNLNDSSRGTGPNKNDDPAGPPQKIQKSQHEGGIRYACPYFKYDRTRHEACGNKGYEDISRLKEHLKRKHFVHRCQRCGVIMKTKKDLIDHRPRPECFPPVDRASYDFSSGYDQDQAEEVKQRDRGGDETEKWVRIYKVLFPYVTDESVPEPFFEPNPTSQEDPNQILHDYDDYRDQDRDNSPFVTQLEDMLRAGPSARDIMSLFRARNPRLRQQFLTGRPTRGTQGAQMSLHNSPTVGPPFPLSNAQPAATTNSFNPTHLLGDSHFAGAQNMVRDTSYINQVFDSNRGPDSTYSSGNSIVPESNLFPVQTWPDANPFDDPYPEYHNSMQFGGFSRNLPQTLEGPASNPTDQQIQTPRQYPQQYTHQYLQQGHVLPTPPMLSEEVQNNVPDLLPPRQQGHKRKR